MKKSNRANRFSPEVRARAVRMVFEHQNNYDSQSAAIAGIAAKIGWSIRAFRSVGQSGRATVMFFGVM